MKRNPIEEGRLTSHGQGIGTVTEEMVRQRAGEIAVINGRREKEIIEGDLDQARRELLGEESLNPQQTAAEAVPEGERWPEVPHSTGRKTPTVPISDEQTYSEKLVDEGVGEAEHDQAVEAEKASLRREE